MRKLLAVAVVVCWGLGSKPVSFGQQSERISTSIVDAHEGITIGVDPWTQAGRYKAKFPKKSPFNAGIVALHLTIRNDNDEGVKLNLTRVRLLVQLDEENRQELETLTAEEVADTVLLKQNGKDPTARRNPLPFPLPAGRPKAERDKNWEEFKDACQNAAIPSSVVGAHSTMEGLVYFDLRGEWDLMKAARLYVPDLQRMSTRDAISYFDIDFKQSD